MGQHFLHRAVRIDGMKNIITLRFPFHSDVEEGIRTPPSPERELHPPQIVFKSKQVDNGVKAISAILGDHYPEFKGKTCFVHFPGIVSTAWRAACLIIVPEKTARKMAFYADPAEGLLKDIDATVLSDRVGGLCAEGTTLFMQTTQEVCEEDRQHVIVTYPRLGHIVGKVVHSICLHNNIFCTTVVIFSTFSALGF